MSKLTDKTAETVMAKRSGWSWKAYYKKYVASSVSAYEEVANQQAKKIPGWLRKPGNGPILANALQGISTYHATLGLFEVGEGRATGWSHIRASFDLISFSIQLFASLIAADYPGPSLHLGMTVNTLFGAIALDRRDYAHWCARHLLSALKSKVYARHGKDVSYPWQLHSAYAFSIEIASMFSGVEIPTHDLSIAPAGDYGVALDFMRRDDLEKALTMLCELHIKDLRKMYNVAGFYPYNLWPAEVITVHLLAKRDEARKDIAIDHQLMQSPYAVVPDHIDDVEIPYFGEVRSYAQQEFPGLGQWTKEG